MNINGGRKRRRLESKETMQIFYSKINLIGARRIRDLKEKLRADGKGDKPAENNARY